MANCSSWCTYDWCNHTTTVSANTVTYNNIVWPMTTSSTTTGWLLDSTWQSWSSQTVTAHTNMAWEAWAGSDPSWVRQEYVQIPLREPTPEELAEREARRAETERIWAEQERLRVAADVTARSLLELVLSEAQLRDHQLRGFFEVRGSAGRRYRVHTNGSKSGNVKLMVGETGEEVAASLCAHLYGREPTADSFLAQKLALEDDEEGFWAVANPSWRVPRDSIEVPRPARLRVLRERPVQLAA